MVGRSDRDCHRGTWGLAREYLSAVEHVVGPQTGIKAVTIEENHDRGEKQAEICAAADAVDSGDGWWW